ncbi:MAG: N-acetylmuramoyl-L-alanine amidase [Chitinophagaceae bacterium]
MKTRTLLLLSIGLAALGCSKKMYTEENTVYKEKAATLADTIKNPPVMHASVSDSLFMTDHWLGTSNFNLRKPNIVVIHHTAQNSCEQTFNTFRTESKQVSAHYVICRDGVIQHMLNDYLRAWHAGIGSWGNISDINSSSIGIELDNNGNEPFSDQQINSLLKLLSYLKKTYNIPNGNFIGHADVAPGRKVDPSAYFPWQKLAYEGFGYWWSDTTGVTVPDNFNALEALRIIGYNVKDSAKAVAAFKLHFEHKGVPETFLTPNDKKIIYTLYRKYL